MANQATTSFYGSNPTPLEGVALEALVSQATASSTQALAKAAEAAQSAVEASASADNAAASEAGAATQAAFVDSRATAAAASATSASTSATNAANSASSAATSATNAANSATSAATSVADATAAASTAITKASEAASSATSASGSASTATTKASEASTSASNASTSASTATTKASEASTSAATATTKAGEAATSASTATTKASEASTSASNASSSASAAATSATNASNSATAAATSATSAAASAAAADGYPQVLVGQGQIPAGSSVGTVDIAVPSGYNAFDLVFEYFLPVTDGSSLYLRFSTDGGASFLSTGYVWAMRYTDTAATPADVALAATTTEYRLAVNQLTSANNSGAAGTLKFWQPPNSSTLNVPSILNSTSQATTARRVFTGGGTVGLGAGNRITNIRLFASAGNIKQCAYRLYGIKSVVGV